MNELAHAARLAALAAALASVVTLGPAPGAHAQPTAETAPAQQTDVPTEPPTDTPPAATTAAPTPSATTVVTTAPSATVTSPPTLTAPAPTTAVPTVITATTTTTTVATPDIEPTEPPGVPREERPILVVQRFDVNPDVPAAGGVFRLALTVRNVGERRAENVQLTLGGQTFLPTGGSPVLYRDRLEDDDEHTFEAELRVADETKSGLYPLAVSLRWDDARGGSYTDEATVGIEVSGTISTRPAVIVTASSLPGRVVPGAQFTLGLTLLNSGGREAHNVVVAPTAGPLVLQGASGGLLHIRPGGSARVNLRVMAAEVGEPGATAQTIELRYDDPEGERFTDTQTIGVVVTGEDVSGPLPMVVANHVADELHPGEEFELALDITNVGSEDALRTRVALGGGASPLPSTGDGTSGGSSTGSLGPFAPLGTSNVRYLGTLAAGESQTLRQRMRVDGAAKPGVYVVEVSFSYVDAYGEALQTSESVTLLVARRVRLSINPIQPMTETVVGQPIPFSFEVVNAGSAALNVGTVEVDGGDVFRVEDGSRFVGSLDANGIDTLDALLIPKRAADEADVTVVVHYVDDFNQDQTFEQTFTFRVNEEPEMPDESLEPVERPEGNLFVRIVRGLLGLGASPPVALPAESIEGPAEGFEEGGASVPRPGFRAAPAESAP
jgi:hypothetical protein